MRSASFILLILIAACVHTETATQRRAYYRAMVGQSEAALIQKLGLPTRRERVDDHEFLTYEQSDVWLARGGRLSPRTLEPGPALASFDCQITYVVVQGVVSAYQMRGNGC